MGLLDGASLVALDTETTGFDPATQAVVEVAAVPIESGSIAPVWSSLVNPRRPIPAGSTFVHGITDDMVAAAPDAGAVARPLRARCAGRMLVFHNAAFDLPFLASLLRAGGQPPLLDPVVDTVGLARGLLTVTSYSLAALAEVLNLAPLTRHRAAGDALTTARLFLVLAARWERERGITSLAELAAASQDVVRLANASRARVIESALLAVPSAVRRSLEGVDVETAIAPVTGQLAPEFRLRGPGGQHVTLSEFRGRNVVLVFYPLAFSPTCSHQLPDMQSQIGRFEALDTVVLGISVDSHWSNQAFAKSLGLTFPLLSDLQREASHAYGVFLPEKGYSARVTFVIDKQGRLVHREDAAGPSGFPSADRVLEALGRL